MISIIIPTFNRENLLCLALDSFARQEFPIDKFEILIIDNGSTDNTKQVVENAIAVHPHHNICYIHEPEPGLLSGRHRGALEAKGDIFTFVDDDIQADLSWLQAIEDTFSNSSVQLVGGRNLPKYEVNPPEWLEGFWEEHPYGRTCSQLSLLDFGNQIHEIDANYIWGLNFSIRKQALFELGGFHPDIVPKSLQYFQGDGETGLTLKANQLGYKAIYQPKAMVLHNIPKERMTYKYFEKRYFYQGVCNSYTDIRRTKGKLEKESFLEKLKKPAKVLNRTITSLLAENKYRQEEREELKKSFYNVFLKGYNFHKILAYNNPKLLDWICKENYWDYKLPKFRFKTLQ